jgi:hypothetical protein
LGGDSILQSGIAYIYCYNSQLHRRKGAGSSLVQIYDGNFTEDLYLAASIIKIYDYLDAAKVIDTRSCHTFVV